MEDFSLEENLTLSVMLLRICGVLPPDSVNPKIVKALFPIYSLFARKFCAIICVVVYFVGTWFFTKDRLVMIHHCHITIHCIAALLKGYQIWKGRHIVIELFQLSKTEEMIHKSHDQHQLLKTNFKYWAISSNAFIIGSVVSVGWVMFAPLLKGVEELPLPSWYPFDYYRSPIYELCYIHQVVAVFFIACCNSVVDNCLAALLIYMATQCRMLKMDLLTFETLEEVSDEEMRKRLIKIIKHHQTILLFAKKTQDLFAVHTLAQLFSNILSLTCCMYLMYKAPLGHLNFIEPGMHYLVIILQLYLYCWLGQLLISESSDLPEALAAHVPWYEQSLAFRKIFIIFLHRSQKPVVIRAGHLLDLSLQTFASIIRTSYSYLTVLMRVAD